MNRQIALTKRISLAEFSEDWSDCYVIIRPATYAEVKEFTTSNIKDLTPEQQLQRQMEIIKDHFVSGKLKIVGEDGVPELADMKPSDAECSMAMANKIFFDILGVTLDPKGSTKAA